MYEWDMRTRQCRSRWCDEGSSPSTSLALSSSGRNLGVGSSGVFLCSLRGEGVFRFGGGSAVWVRTYSFFVRSQRSCDRVIGGGSSALFQCRICSILRVHPPSVSCVHVLSILSKQHIPTPNPRTLFSLCIGSRSSQFVRELHTNFLASHSSQVLFQSPDRLVCFCSSVSLRPSTMHPPPTLLPHNANCHLLPYSTGLRTGARSTLTLSL